MAKKNRNKTTAPTWAAQSRDEVNAAIAEIGVIQRDRSRIEAEMNDELANVKAKFEERAKPLGERKKELVDGIAAWCNANRDQLTQNGKVKFHQFATGEVSWRWTPWAVKLTKPVAFVIASLKARRLGKHIRKKEEVDKESLLANRARLEGKVDGIKFGQVEEFAVTPNESKIEEVQ